MVNISRFMSLPNGWNGCHLQGSKILSAVLHSLEMILRGAKLVVIGGCSAGGRGAFYNLVTWKKEYY